jgi:hypothetical protein
MCRALATVRTGRSCSKQEGGAWVQGLSPEWAWVIDAALATRRSRGTTGFADHRSRSGAIALIEFLAEQVTAGPGTTA